MMTRRSILAGIAGSLPGVACGRRHSSLSQLTVALTPRVTSAAIYLAHERGLFRDEGLEIQFSEFAGQQEVLPALAGGQADVALMGFSGGICNAIARGARIRIVAGRDALKPGCSDQGALYYRRPRFPHGIEQARDWKGAHIALTSDSNMGLFYVDQLLSYQGISPSSVEISRMRIEEAVAAASGGHVDLFFGSGRPEFLNGGLPGDVARTDLLMSVLGAFQYTYVMFGARPLDGDPKIGAAFLTAYLRGVRSYAAGETPRFLSDLSARMHWNPELVKAGCRGNIAMDGAIREKDMEKWLAWAVANKTVTQAMTPGQLVDMRFQQAALQRL